MEKPLGRKSIQEKNPVTVLNINFAKIKNLKDTGWEQSGSRTNTFWSLKKNSLFMRFDQDPYKGGTLTKEFPNVEKGQLDIYLATNVNNGKYDHLTLRFDFNNKIYAFKYFRYKHLLLNYKEKEKRWDLISNLVPNRKKFLFRIQF